MKKKIVRILLGVMVLAAAGGSVYLLNAPKEVPLTKVALKTAELTFTEQGTVASGQVVQIYSLSSGEVLNVAVKEGQHVNSGDVICNLDSEAILQKIDQVNNTISGYEAQLGTWQSGHQNQNQTVKEKQKLQNILIEQSEKNLEQAKKELEHLIVLYENGFLSLSDLEQAQSSVKQHELMLESQQQELNLISNSDDGSQMGNYYQALIDIEQSNLKLLKKELAQTTVTATSYGIITALPVQETNYISNLSLVAEITATDNLFVETYVSTNDINSIALGDTVILTLNQRDGDISYEGTVSQINDTAVVMISSLGLEERKVKVEITPHFSSINENIGIGYDLDVQFLLYKEEDQITVPKTALFKDYGMDKVWVVENGTLHAVEVVTGMELRTETIILSGLENNDLVVTDANDEILKEGLTVITKQ